MIGHFQQNQIELIFSALTKLQKRSFTKNNLSKILVKSVLDENNLTLDKILHGLFKVGAICHYKKNNVQGGYDSRVYSYLMEDYQLLIDEYTQFEIHVGLWNVLQVKPPKNRFN